MELHRGRIEAHSPGIDRGSTFTVWLPRFTYAMAGVADATQADSKRWNGMRLLLVDDEAAAEALPESRRPA